MKKFDQINVIPFIDIMLVLLAIVLLTASFTHNGKIDVSLPAADNAEPVETQELPHVITVKADGSTYLDDQAQDLGAIETAMNGWQKNQPILLKIDKQSAFEHFVNLTALLKKEELRNVSILTETAP